MRRKLYSRVLQDYLAGFVGTVEYYKRVTGRFAHFPVRPESFRPESFRPESFRPPLVSRFALLP